MFQLLKSTYTFVSGLVSSRPGTSSDDESGYESASSGGSFNDCLSDIGDLERTLRIKEEREPVASDGKIVGFTDVHPKDDFLQSNNPFVFRKVTTPPWQTKGSTTIYKNQLQTLCQRDRINIPSYSHVKEGPDHEPRFKASVEVNGELFKSTTYYPSKGEAEQAVAKIAHSKLSRRSRNSLSCVQPNINCQVSTDGSNNEGSVKSSEHGSKAGRVSTKSFTKEQRYCNDAEFDSTFDSSQILDELSSFDDLVNAHDMRWKSRSNGVSKCTTSLPKYSSALFSQIPGQFPKLHVNNERSQQLERTLWQHQFVKRPETTEHLRALGTLEFSTKAFPLLTRLKGLRLDEAYSVDEILELEHIQADQVTEHLWKVDRQHGRPTTRSPPPRGQNDPQFILYDCYVKASGELHFQISANKQKATTLLQRELGFDRVLRVFFENGPKDPYRKLANKGIFVGHRLYEFFIYKACGDDIFDETKNSTEGMHMPQGDDTKNTTEGIVNCYFVCTNSIGERDQSDSTFRMFNSIVEVRDLFMHIRTCPSVHKFIARLQLCLTKTLTITMPWSKLVIKKMEDLYCKDVTGVSFTDGTGFISADLARHIPPDIFKGRNLEEDTMTGFQESYPSLVQIRLFHDGAAHKGTLLTNTQLPANTIKVYSSMRKVQHDPELKGHSIKSFELVSTSRKPRRARLSQDLILLLSMGEVPQKIFVNALQQAIDRVSKIFYIEEYAIQELRGWDCEKAQITLRMIAAGIPLSEPGLRKNLYDLTTNSMQNFSKGKVPLEGSFYLMGTADPTGLLKPHQVAITRGDNLIQPKRVLVYRAPGKHPGDIHVLEVVCPPDLMDIVGTGKYVIFFSTQGTRPVPHEIAKGDLDGDLYWICENPQVVSTFTEWRFRWSPRQVTRVENTMRPLDMTPEELNRNLFEECLTECFDRKSIVGLASVRWLQHADAYVDPDTSQYERQIHLEQLLKYPDYIYEAVDRKSGVKIILPERHRLINKSAPVYLRKAKKGSQKEEGSRTHLKGSSILKQIFEMAQKAEEDRKPPSYDRIEIDPEFDFPNSEKHEGYWQENLIAYNKEISIALEDKGSANYDPDEPDRIYAKYRMYLYGAPSFKDALKYRKKEYERILEEAAAIYKVVYNKANRDVKLGNSPKFAFAWTVAGEALSFIYEQNQPGKSIVFSATTYKKVYGRSRGTRAAPLQGRVC